MARPAQDPRWPASPAWRLGFAAGLALRPVVIVPMASSGPLGGSDLLPLALGLVFVASGVLALGACLGNRLALAFGILTGAVGVPIAAIGWWAGLPMPWPLVVGVWNLVLVPAGLRAWPPPEASR